MAPRAGIALAILAALCAQAVAYPSLWAGESHVKCPDHPTKKEDGHGAPRPDPTIKFAVTDKAGKTAAGVCPGATYTVTVSFGGDKPRLALLTADAGTFAKADQTCPSRQVMDRTKGYTPNAAQTASLTVACTATKALQLRVTSATGSTANFLQASTSLPVDPKCSAC